MLWCLVIFEMMPLRKKIVGGGHRFVRVNNELIIFYDFNLSPESNLSSRVIEFVRVKFEQPIFDMLVNLHVIKRGQWRVAYTCAVFRKIVFIITAWKIIAFFAKKKKRNIIRFRCYDKGIGVPPIRV